MEGVPDGKEVVLDELVEVRVDEAVDVILEELIDDIVDDILFELSEDVVDVMVDVMLEELGGVIVGIIVVMLGDLVEVTGLGTRIFRGFPMEMLNPIPMPPKSIRSKA